VNTIGVADKKSKKALAKAKKGDKKGKKSAPSSPSSLPMDSKQKQKLGLGKSLVKKLSNNNLRKAMEEETAQTQPSLFRLLVVKKVGGDGENGGGGECIYKLSSCERKGNQATKSTSSGRITREKSNNQLNSSINGNSSTNGPSKGGGEPLFFGTDDHDGKLKSQEKQKGSGKANYTLKLLEKKPVGEAKVAPIVTLSNITIA